MLKRCESFFDKAVVSKSDFSPEPSAPAIAAGFLAHAQTWKKTKAETSGSYSFRGE